MRVGGTGQGKRGWGRQGSEKRVGGAGFGKEGGWGRAGSIWKGGGGGKC